MASTNIDIKLAQLDQLNVAELTTKELNGTGVFDVLMSTTSLHIQKEFDKGRIRGPEYAQVYLGGLQATLASSIQYLTQSKTLGIEIANQEKQGQLTDAQRALVEAQTNQITSEVTLKLPAEVANIAAATELSTANKEHTVAQTTQVGKQTLLITKQTDQLTAELAKIPVEILLLEKQVTQATTQNTLIEKQVESMELQNTKVPKEIAILEKQILQADASIALSTAQKDQIVTETTTRLPIEVQNLTKQGLNMDAQVEMSEAQTAQVIEQTKRIPYDIEEIQARIVNMGKQNLLLEKDYEIRTSQLALQAKQLQLSEAELEVKRQELQVQLAAIESQRAQAQLYAQKVTTEKAQTESGVAATDSVLGANIAVLSAQAAGYTSDKLQKAAKILVDTWNVRRNSDDGVVNDVTNQLHDANIGVAVSGLLLDAGLTPNTTGY